MTSSLSIHLQIGKTYFFRGEFYDEDGEPQSLDECRFVVRDGTEQIIFEQDVAPGQEGVYEFAYAITKEDGIGVLMIGFEGTIGEQPEATERVRVERVM
jgi:hypothetical protein